MKEQKESCVNERAEHPESGSTKRRISKKGGKVELRGLTDRFKSQGNKNEETNFTKMEEKPTRTGTTRSETKKGNKIGAVIMKIVRMFCPRKVRRA